MKGTFLVLLALWAAGSRPSSAETVISKEYQVKAVFLFNFAQFVQWPPSAFKDPGEPFQIGILGDDPFGAFLDETVKGEKVDGHPLVIKRFRSVQEVKNCKILFISKSEMGHLEDVLAGLKRWNILTVGDAEGFLRKGGITRFVMDNNKVHLRISVRNAKRADLIISSKILRLAEIVEYGKE